MSDERPRILVVDDDAIVAEALAGSLAAHGYDVDRAPDGDAALELIGDAERLSPTGPARPYAVVLTDMSMPGMSGLDLIKAIKKRGVEAVPIAMTGYGAIETAVQTIRAGAIDYLVKPIVDEELRVAIERAVQQHTLRAENGRLRRQLESRDGLDNIIGRDPRMQRIFDVVEAVAAAKTTVLMCGESGVGKSMVARAIHRRSDRADQPFVELACGSIPETLLESELFGHVKGAFSGAHADKAGKFLAAHGGTLFLDEINSASPGMQLKLLRVLQEKQFEPVGSNETISVDVRVILATNQPLEQLVERGEFRPDLYHRINVVNIELPPLRERGLDIPVLATSFLEKHAAEMGKAMAGFTDAALAKLQAYPYPGNVRELENIVERAVVLSSSPTIDVEDLPDRVIDPDRPMVSPRFRADGGDEVPFVAMSLREAMEGPERAFILAALRANDWNRQQTADALEINRTTLYKKIKQYGLEQEDAA